MNRLLIIIIPFLLLSSSISFSQTGYLFVKKGIKKKRTYTEGDIIHVKLQDGNERAGIITLLRNDTIFINGRPVHKTFVKEVLQERKPKKPFPDGKTVLLISAGAALTATGLAISGQATTQEAVIAGAVIGFGPLLIKHFGGRGIRAMKRKKFRIGKKFYLQVLDFHIPQPQRIKTF
ncbi:MAG TPA: hypothetical protein VIZ28_04860 [Chitinophagaceae bacterium]